jgi:hypothetical protein
MRALAAALLLTLPTAQDDARIAELIQRLEDDSVEARENAQKELIRIGEPALAPLRKAVEQAGTSADRGELRVRGSAAIRQIDLAVKSRAVYQDPKLVTFRASGMKLSEAAASIGKQAGVRIDASAVDGEAAVTCDLKAVPLFLALDELCRGQEERTYEYKEEGVVKLLKDRHVAHPTAYAGPFRVRILTMKVERSTDFKSKKSSLFLTLDADCEKYLKPWKNPEIEITGATDDKGTALEVKEGEGDEDANVAGGRAFAKIVVGGAAFFGGQDPNAGQKTYTLKGLAAGATQVSLQGTVRFRFPLETREIKFDRPAAGATQETADYTVRLDAQANRRQWTLSFRRKKAAAGTTASLNEEVEQRVDSDSLVGIDEDGGEHKGTLLSANAMGAAIRVVNGRLVQDSDVASFTAQFNTVKLKPLKEIRFKFSDATFVKPMPFAVEKTELP